MTSGLKQDEHGSLYMVESGQRIDVACADKGHLDFELRHKWHLAGGKDAKAEPAPCGNTDCTVCSCKPQ